MRSWPRGVAGVMKVNSIQFNSIPLFYLFVEYVNNSMWHTYEYNELLIYHTIRKDSRKAEHDEVAFQLAAGDFGSNSLWQTSYLKYNSSMYILHQYHLMGELKAWTAMCRSEKKWGNMFKMADDRFVVHVSSAVWGGGGLLLQWKNMK